MKKCIIIGKTNVGKTMFLINFAEYLGLKYIDFKFTNFAGICKNRRLDCKKARTILISNDYHKTRCIQSITLNVPLGKGKKKIEFIDTTGLVDDIHPNVDIRKAISQTLAMIRDSDIILHILDASVAGNKDLPKAIGEVDYQIAQFAQLKSGYAILANKIDLPDAELGVRNIKSEFQGNLVIPISALYKKGFREVKTFVVHNI